MGIVEVVPQQIALLEGHGAKVRVEERGVHPPGHLLQVGQRGAHGHDLQVQFGRRGLLLLLVVLLVGGGGKGWRGEGSGALHELELRHEQLEEVAAVGVCVFVFWVGVQTFITVVMCNFEGKRLGLTAHHVHLVHDQAGELPDLPLLDELVDEAVGLLDGAHPDVAPA